MKTTRTFKLRRSHHWSIAWLFWLWNWFQDWRITRRYRGRKLVINGRESTIKRYRGKTFSVKEPLPEDITAQDIFTID